MMLPRDSTRYDASYLLVVIYTDCKEEYYLWYFIEPAAKMRPLTTSTHIDMHIDIAQTRVK